MFPHAQENQVPDWPLHRQDTKGLEGGGIHPMYEANSVAKPRLKLKHPDP